MALHIWLPRGSQRMIRLAIIDDQTLVRSGISRLLGTIDGIEVVGEAADAVHRSAVRVIEMTAPDPVLLDVRMPGGSDIDVLKEFGRAQRLPPTILLTTFDDHEALIEALRHGAKGFRQKDILFDRLVEAIRHVANGGNLMLGVHDRARG